MPGYMKVLDYGLMRAHYAEAEKRAERLGRWREEEGDRRGNPYTGVYELTRLILKNGKR